MNLCPICEQPGRTTCRCPRGDTECENGHRWHRCEVHRRVVIGESDHAKSGCSCPAVPPHPMQPVVLVGDVIRFRKNPIVDRLLEHCSSLPGSLKLGLNELCDLGFANEDFEQFAQLIGYSVSGFNSLSYVSDLAAERAQYSAQQHQKVQKRKRT